MVVWLLNRCEFNNQIFLWWTFLYWVCMCCVQRFNHLLKTLLIPKCVRYNDWHHNFVASSNRAVQTLVSKSIRFIVSRPRMTPWFIVTYWVTICRDISNLCCLESIGSLTCVKLTCESVVKTPFAVLNEHGLVLGMPFKPNILTTILCSIGQ